jgi:hypothetical protein
MQMRFPDFHYIQILKTFQNIQSLFLFAGRNINFFLRYFFFQYFFRTKIKKKYLKKKIFLIKYFFFFHPMLLKRKKINFSILKQKLSSLKKKKAYLSALLNFFSSAHCGFLKYIFLKNFLLVLLNLNLNFFSKFRNQVQNKKI